MAFAFFHLPGGAEVKASACNVGDPGSIPGSGRSPGRRKWQPTPVLTPGKFHGWRSLVGYGPWGHKESDMTEQLKHTHKELLLIYNIIKIKAEETTKFITKIKTSTDKLVATL